MNFKHLKSIGITALMVVLAACGSQPATPTPEPQPQVLPPTPPPPAAGSFSMSVLETLSIQKGQSKNVVVLFARNSFPDDINLSLKSGPLGLSSDLPKATAGDQINVTLSAAEGEAPSPNQYDVVFEATSKGISKTATLKLTVEPAPAVPHPKAEVNLVRLTGFGGSKEVRQGYGNVILGLEGKNLSGISQARLERQEDKAKASKAAVDLIPATILSKSDSAMSLEVNVQHGAVGGIYDLVIVNGNVTKVEGVLVVSSITAAPSGNDASGRGTSDSPFRSLSKAVSVATSADRLVLREGEYNRANGENFPLNVLGLSIRGASKDKTIINGADSTNDCLVVAGSGVDTSIADLEVRGCTGEGIQLEGSKTLLSRVSLRENKQSGLRLAGTAQATIRQSDFVGNTDNGLSARDSAQIVLEGEQQSRFTMNGQSGIYLIVSAKLTGRKLLVGGNLYGLRSFGSQVMVSLQESSLNENTSHGILVDNSQSLELDKVNVLNSGGQGIRVIGNTKLSLSEVQVNQSKGDGIHVNVEADETADVRLDMVQIRGNGESGIEYRSANPASFLWMAESVIADNDTFGLYIAGKSTSISLGHLKPANNILRDNGSTYLVDARDAGTGTILANGTDFATAGILTNASGPKNGPTTQAPHWQIVNAGNSINFGAP